MKKNHHKKNEKNCEYYRPENETKEDAIIMTDRERNAGFLKKVKNKFKKWSASYY